ncbi:type II toxin-antitoxin system RelE/ParE family toxin [Coleofasciculus sp. G2-EDA-02]|uniref:type II toxin-antitoxin system RelE/ParE family toxin n=1 Tax=Coleofasciculus sp. G2-EDA-02 TaxID=3069529 RepID=UPI0032FE4A59
MVFQIKLTRYAKEEIESAYLWLKDYNSAYADQWFRDLMDTIATLQEKPRRCALARENDDFLEEIRQLLYGKSKSRYRIVFTVKGEFVYILSVRRGSRSALDFNPLDME